MDIYVDNEILTVILEIFKNLLLKSACQLSLGKDIPYWQAVL